jgi:hypothetical protein
MSKIKIRIASWHVFADDGTQHPPYLGLVCRDAYQDCFLVFGGGPTYPQQPPTFATFTEAVDYLRANQAEAAA